jgi:Ni2+-binding GTPase involved in maturation of urease and hydrogenase
MIIESEIKSLKEEKVNLKDETVESSNAYLPKLFMCSMFIGSKGSGKTYSLVSLLKHYEKSFFVMVVKINSSKYNYFKLLLMFINS